MALPFLVPTSRLVKTTLRRRDAGRPRAARGGRVYPTTMPGSRIADRSARVDERVTSGAYDRRCDRWLAPVLDGSGRGCCIRVPEHERPRRPGCRIPTPTHTRTHR